MHITIFDVGHGFCAQLFADNGNVMLFDCGQDGDLFRPSSHFLAIGVRRLNHLIVSHFDDDHVRDLHNVAALFPIDILLRNPSGTPEQVRRAKLQLGPLSSGMESVLTMMSTFSPPGTPLLNPPDFAGVQVLHFWNSWPSFPIEDQNNLSLVSFVFYDGLGVIIPGDLERAGWLELLKNPAFRTALNRTNIFVTSHHGRQNGYCSEVFDHCDPEIVIISDAEIQFDSQEHSYATHAKGIWFSRDGMRYVLTTRRDGHIGIQKYVGQPFTISIR